MEPCNGQLSVFYGLPYSLFSGNDSRPNPLTNVPDDPVRFWLHIGLIILCFLLAIINFILQFCKTIPYGRFDVGAGRCRVNQRIGFGLSDGIPGIILFTLAYFMTGTRFNGAANIVMYCLFIIHYINRAIIQPIANRHSRSTVVFWVPIVNLLVNALFHYVNADYIGSANFCQGYYFDPRFILGIIIMVTGFIINRVADAQLICLRENYKDNSYKVPKGPLFFLITTPHYLGELIEWFGWALLTWSLAGVVWFLFVASTLVPRARAIHKWSKNEFDDYPKRRKALIPFIY